MEVGRLQLLTVAGAQCAPKNPRRMDPAMRVGNRIVDHKSWKPPRNTVLERRPEELLVNHSKRICRRRAIPRAPREVIARCRTLRPNSSDLLIYVGNELLYFQNDLIRCRVTFFQNLRSGTRSKCPMASVYQIKAPPESQSNGRATIIPHLFLAIGRSLQMLLLS